MTDAAGLRLDELLRELPPGTSLQGEGGVRVAGVHQDSRRVTAGDLFVARRGVRADGASFLEQALSRGAVAVLTESDLPVPVGVPILRVPDARVGLALAAAAVYGHPAFSLEVIGITGTNGKTTTAHLVRAAVDGAVGAPSCGLIGTIGHQYRSLQVDAAHTTPEADELARVLASMRDLGATHAAMEVSSIALTNRRVHAIRFRVAAFTNLTQDHLDFHGSMDAYAAAKAELFTAFAPGSAVIHVGDPFGRDLATRVTAPLIRVTSVVGASPADAEIAPRALSLSERGIRGIVRVPGGDVELESPLFGAHNAENLLVALGIVSALGLDVQRAALALRDERGALGRLQRIETSEDDVVALVDYAHTPDAVSRALTTARSLTGGRVIIVFGCGGDRDSAKRPLMGEAAAASADVVIVTNDNPRTERPEDIAAAVVDGIRATGMSEILRHALGPSERGYLVELDRARAIELAIASAAPRDTLLICGKGHETYQIVGAEHRSFDDAAVTRAALERRRRATKTAISAGH